MKNYIHSNSIITKKTEEWDIHVDQRFDINTEWDKHTQQRFDINDSGRIMSADNIRQEHFVWWIPIMEAHTGDKQFTSNVCDRFTQSSNLKTHHMTHTGDKPFA